MKNFRDILIESKGPIRKEDLVPGFAFFVLSKDGRTVSRFKIIDEIELNVGPTLNVKQTHVAGDKVPQNKISKDFVLGIKGDIKVFRSKNEAISAFKRAGLFRESELPDSIKNATRKEKISLLRDTCPVCGFEGFPNLSALIKHIQMHIY